MQLSDGKQLWNRLQFAPCTHLLRSLTVQSGWQSKVNRDSSSSTVSMDGVPSDSAGA